ncbi:hypothetical protein A5658_21160 [Mycobacterium sp. 1245111.1]|uniref:hypothetical protein n=1 Tax=Mycobacterium sp. 1245111.1 TaxID=1834073 RepID=UPI000801F8AF|nr:hypothetical protein [Mycobacterium sp. 1245111.1]OBK40496.1 hypothetical protein A5658_21160 [Mycobacterium sp. 1245111.1]
MTTLKNIAVAGLLSFGLAAGMYATAGTALSDPGRCSNGGPQPDPPCRWCPGDPPVATGNHVTNPVRWDESVCHNYWMVWFGQGNVAQNVFEGDAPPPPPPPGPPGLINRDNCQQILGMFCPHA